MVKCDWRGFNHHVRQRRDREISRERRRVFAAAEIFGDYGAAIELSVFIHIREIIFLKNVVGRRELADEVRIRIRSGDEIIADGIQKMIRPGVSAHETADTPVADHVVNLLNRSLRLWIAALVVDPKIVRVGDVRHGIGERTEALRVNALADDAVLKRDVVAALRDAETIPAAPLDAAMIKNHVTAVGKINGTFSLVALNAFAETQITHDDIALAAEGNGASVQHDAVAGRGLAGERDAAVDGDV